MIDLPMAALIAGVAVDALTSIDTIYRGYADFFRRKKATIGAPPPDFSIQNKPEEKAIVTVSAHNGQTSQKITYEDLTAKLDPPDRAYIEGLSQSLDNYQRKWNEVYEAKSLAAGMDVGSYDAELNDLAKQIADPLLKALKFVQNQMGVALDDHYKAAREIAEEYIKQDQPK